MKLTILTLTAISAVLFSAVAANSATCQVGVKGGVAIQKLSGDDVPDEFDSRTGFVGGAYLLADFSQSFGLRVESLYFMKGASADSADASVTFQLDYLEFPVLLVAHVPLSETARLDFFGGPTFGFNVKSKLKVEVGGASASFDLDGAETFEFGMTFGAGLNFDAGPVVLGIDGRYGLGVTDIASDSDSKNRGFAVMGSIGFPIGQK